MSQGDNNPRPLAIGAAPPESSSQNPSSQNPIPQPRQPQNLQGLLRFAMEATKAEDAPHESQFEQMSEEKRRFLEEALKSMTVDVVEILVKNINTLRNAGTVSVDGDVAEYTGAFDSILDHVDRIDTAIDFHKIGGYDIFIPCFSAVHSTIRAGACDLLAELCQNNPYCQEKAFQAGFMKILLDLLNNDPDDHVAIKALYAISCLIRENPVGLKEFQNLNGPSVLMNSLNKPNDKIRTKGCFLLSTLCTKETALRDQFVSLGLIEILISLLAQERRESSEHILSALLSILIDNENAINECRNEKYGLACILNNYLKAIENMDEVLEEKDYCNRILRLISTPTTSCTVER